MYVTEERLREVLTMLADAGGTLAVTCTVPAPNDGTQTVQFGQAPRPVGWELYRDPSQPMPPPPNAVAAAVGPRPMYGGVQA